MKYITPPPVDPPKIYFRKFNPLVEDIRLPATDIMKARDYYTKYPHSIPIVSVYLTPLRMTKFSDCCGAEASDGWEDSGMCPSCNDHAQYQTIEECEARITPLKV